VYGNVGISGPVEISGGSMNVRIESSALDIEMNYDAFARQRVSNPYTLYDFTSVYGKDPLRLTEEISGAGASSTENADSFIEMAVTNTGESVIRQTKEYIPYQPGKSRLIYMTGVLVNSLSSQVISRFGCFDASMGYFLEFNNGVVSIVERANGVDTATIRGS